MICWRSDHKTEEAVQLLGPPQNLIDSSLATTVKPYATHVGAVQRQYDRGRKWPCQAPL
jgi:hypothetical protein